MSGIPRDERLGRDEPIREPYGARSIRKQKQVEGEGVVSHAYQHGTEGDDALAPADIDAASDDHTHAPLNNLAAPTAPAVTDDADSGYGVGSLWIDITNGSTYICVDPAIGAADWNQIDAGGGASVAVDEIWDLLGDLVYGTGPDAGTRLPGNTTATKKFLTQTGDGAASAAPAWGALVEADIPAAIARDSEVTSAIATEAIVAVPFVQYIPFGSEPITGQSYAP